ncbi:DEAD/DEAH box helicase family protein [Kitasatospora sp. NPDC002227]|uniref:DEAD/DEAH box helicase n=1 Tax=Kitasatospora sp. NPDC002227 TaxID=3154773 RepID=UPI00331EB836
MKNRFDGAIASYQANPHLVSEHANHEESIRVGGYANRTLLELVQNAADAMAGAPAQPEAHIGRVEIVLDPVNQALYCANAGRPFSASGLTAITHAHLSAKRGDEIGRFGLGFKSVLAVSDSPQVFSRSVSFEFNSAAARAELASITSTARRYPVLRTATVADAAAAFATDPVLAELGEWAATIVKLPRAVGLDRIRQEIMDFSSEFLLFATAVREVRLRVLGSDGLATSHRSRDLGGGVFRIEDPEGGGDEWVVEDRMHRPSLEARKQVGEAVSRSQVKVTVAIPKRHARQRVGRFWSYFPLQDRTSASALFNAPWSVNDDRTTLLKNDYNMEILGTLTEMFVGMLPQVATAEDPAAHFDYMPARGREQLSYGDDLLCTHVPRLSADRELVPDTTGAFRRAAELRPLDLTVPVDTEDHQKWSASPNTGVDVPHWRCYTSSQRTTRLRQVLIAATSPGLIDDRNQKRALDHMPKRGLLSWVREWAEGTDQDSTANAFRFVFRNLKNREFPGLDQAKVIPASGGLRSLADKDFVFLQQEEDLEIENAEFVAPSFLALPGVAASLQAVGFQNLDPLAILKARVGALSGEFGDTELTRLWEAVLGVTEAEAVRVLQEQTDRMMVPTRDGGWRRPLEVFDLDVSIGEEHEARVLDRTRCSPRLAHRLGVVNQPAKKYALEDEPEFEQYRKVVLAALDARRGLGERPIERIEFFPDEGPGPASALFMLAEAGATPQLREFWTVELLKNDTADWACEDLDTGTTHPVTSPVRWAVSAAGIVQSNHGYCRPTEVVDPSMVKYEKLLPLFKGTRPVADALKLPKELAGVPVNLLKKAVEADLFAPGLSDELIVDFLREVCPVAYPNSRPARIPARVGHIVEGIAPSSVYLATTDEQRDYLVSRQRPCLRVTVDQAEALVALVGCGRFEDNFAFSVVIEGAQEKELVLDVFTGLRRGDTDRLSAATITRAVRVAKRVTTADGVQDEPLKQYLDGKSLVVDGEVDERQLLRIVSEAFDLGLSNHELDEVLQAGIDDMLERSRQEAKAAATDEDRLSVYFGPDDLREALPKGLWPALVAQGLVNHQTSIADLFLKVYGSDSIKQLRTKFGDIGFPDVPVQWAGAAATISWLRKMGFGAEYAGRRGEYQPDEFVVPGAVRLSPLHPFQVTISKALAKELTSRDSNGRHSKAMVELPTGAGKTRVAAETVLRLFIEDRLHGPVLWIAQSLELCEQAVQTWSTVWRGLGDERPLTVGRLWENNTVHWPDTEFSIIVATDAKLEKILDKDEYEWLSKASTVIIDEGHRAGDSERYTRILRWLGVDGHRWERPLVGLSATPFKGTSVTATEALVRRFGKNKLNPFNEGNPYRELADLGVLARVDHEVLNGVEISLDQSERDEATVKRKVSSTVLERLGRDHRRMEILVDHIMGQDPSWPVLVFTPSVLSAQVLAAVLRIRGVEAAFVSGETGRQERRAIIEKFKRNEIRVLANCDLLIQGFDAPGVRALYIARPTFSPNAYIQMAGRGLRGPANGGKDECLIVDMADDFGGDITEKLGYRAYEDLWQEQRP